MDKYKEVNTKEFGPGDVVQILFIDNREGFLFGRRYALVLGPAVKIIKGKVIDGYEIFVGSKIEWHSTKSLFGQEKEVS